MTQTLQQPETSVLIPVKITIEQYHRMIEAGIWDECHVELLNGVIVEMPPEGTPHASKRTTTQEYLTKLLGDLAQLRVAAPITLPNGSEPEPDLAIVQRVADNYLSHHPYPENSFWVMEYSNTSLEKDLKVKRKIYAAVGISEYWLINLRTLELIIFRDPANGDYRSQTILTTGQIHPLSFPAIAIEVTRLLG